MSRSFLSFLIGLAVTLFAWVSPWLWPAKPAFVLLDLLFRHRDFNALSFALRAGTIVLLIAFNAACWAVVAYGVMALAARLATRGGWRSTTRSRPGL